MTHKSEVNRGLVSRQNDTRIKYCHTDHWHEVVDALHPRGVGEQVHDEVAQVGAVRRGDDLHAGLEVLALDHRERVAGQGWKKGGMKWVSSKD